MLMMDERQCPGCRRKYKCLEKSKQIWCSDNCRYTFEGKIQSAKPIVLSSAIGLDLEKKETPKEKDGSIFKTLNIVANKESPMQSDTKKIQFTEKNASQESAEVMSEIRKETMLAEENGPKIIKNDNFKTKGNIMPEINPTKEIRSLAIENEEIPGAVYTRHLINLNEETSTSMSSLDSVKNELLWLMKSLNEVPEHLKDNPNQFHILDQDRVRVASECGKQIISAMRMKLDMLKFAKEVQDANR